VGEEPGCALRRHPPMGDGLGRIARRRAQEVVVSELRQVRFGVVDVELCERGTRRAMAFGAPARWHTFVERVSNQRVREAQERRIVRRLTKDA